MSKTVLFFVCVCVREEIENLYFSTSANKISQLKNNNKTWPLHTCRSQFIPSCLRLSEHSDIFFIAHYVDCLIIS